MPGQQQAAERQPAPVQGLKFQPARMAGKPRKKCQRKYGKCGTPENDDGGGGGGEFAEHTGQAKHQCADMQGAKGGTGSHCNP
ncbi:hypothetical protein PS639_06259 [Pseudomonas fluorescens]|nr:hypothetical protein PS639_06259 [Pseudomonas fluorescens]